MADSILVKVVFPPGGLKKGTTIKIPLDSTVQGAVEECVSSGKLAHPADYHLYLTDGGTRWLEPSRLVTFYGIKDQVTHSSSPFGLFSLTFAFSPKWSSKAVGKSLELS